MLLSTTQKVQIKSIWMQRTTRAIQTVTTKLTTNSRGNTMAKKGQSIRRTGKNTVRSRASGGSRCHVTLRKDGTVYSQERLTVKEPGKADVIVPTMRARDLIEKAGWGRKKFLGPDNIERPIS
jgi:hypothetical protein